MRTYEPSSYNLLHSDRPCTYKTRICAYKFVQGLGLQLVLLDGPYVQNRDCTHKNRDCTHKNRDCTHKNRDCTHKNRDCTYQLPRGQYLVVARSHRCDNAPQRTVIFCGD
jgi:hypothetical protein